MKKSLALLVFELMTHTVFTDWSQVSGVGQDVSRMWEMAIQHALMPAVSTGISHSSHCSGHSKTPSWFTSMRAGAHQVTTVRTATPPF